MGSFRNNKITKGQFEQYYTDLSASIPSDKYFVSMMESVWVIREEGTPDESDVRLQELLEILKEKVRQKTPAGKLEESNLSQTFKFFDRDESGSVSKEEFAFAMEKYGINLAPRDLSTFFKKFDSDGSGKIVYQEFIDTAFGTKTSRREWSK